MRKKLVLGATAVALAVGVTLAGCSASKSPSPEKSSAPTTLTLALQAPPSDFSVGNWGGGDSTIYESVYDSLLTQNLKGELSPGAASAWKSSADGKTLTFTIRTGQKFSDGEALNAKAVVDSLEVSRKAAGSSAQLKSIASVSATNSTTVVVKLSQPDASVLYQLAGSPGVIGAPNSLNSPSAKLDPIGSGPYTLDTAESNTGSLYVLKKNPKYWNTKAYPFDTVKFEVIADPTAVQNAMESGQLDWTTLSSPSLAAQFPSSQFSTGTLLPQAVGALVIVDRTGKVVPALGDVRVRQAINYALDRKLISSKLAPGSIPTDQMANPSGQIFDKALEQNYAFSISKAKKLMSEAGYANGFSLTMPSDVLSTTYDATIQQELAAIGIKVTYETEPFQDLFTKLYSGSYGMFFYYNGYSGSDAKDVGQELSGSFNPFNSTTPKLTSLLSAANSAPAAKQTAAFAAVNKYLVEQAWFAPLNAATGTWVASKSIKYTPSVVTHISLLPFAPAN